jgi:hypothetical protein
MGEILLENISRFQSGFPTIALSEGLVDGLTEGDANPMYITLPIGHVGVTSRNGRTYNREAVQTMVDAINQKRVVGEAGHLRDEDRPYHWSPSPLRWVGATLEGETAWGKAYVLPSFPQVRDYIRVAMKTNAQIGTSIYGTAEVDGEGHVRNLNIESIDLAHPDRLGNPRAAAVPVVTSEMASEDNEGANTQERNTLPNQPTEDTATSPTGVAESTSEQTAQVTGNVPATPPMPQVTQESQMAELRRQHQETLSELHSQIAQLREYQRAHQNLLRELGMDEGDVVNAVRELQTQYQALQGENRDLLQSAIQQMVGEAVALEHARPLVVELVQAQNPTTRTDVQEALQTVMQRDSVKALLREAVATEMGPNVEPTQNRSQEGDDDPIIFIPA